MNNIEKEILTTEPSEEIFNKLEDSNYDEGFFMLNEDATSLEKMKYQLCGDIVEFQINHKISDEDAAKKLGIELKKIKEIVDHRYDKLTFDELSNYNEKLAASVQSKVYTYYSNTYIPNNYYASSDNRKNNYQL